MNDMFATPRIKFTGLTEKDLDFLLEYHSCPELTKYLPLGKPVVRLKASKNKYKLAVQSVKSWIKTNRSSRIKDLMKTYKAKLQGHWNYYGVCGNFETLWKFYWIANRIIFKWINRRSQKRSYNWNVFNEMIKFYKIPRPRIIAY